MGLEIKVGITLEMDISCSSFFFDNLYSRWQKTAPKRFAKTIFRDITGKTSKSYG